MAFRIRTAILLALTAAAVIGMLFVPPIPQDLAYHGFADRRGCFGVPNCGDVLSNVAFAATGAAGLALLLRGGRAMPGDALPYLVVFTGVLLVSAGSAYYHWAPDNARLFWDRLPMTIAFMGFAAAIVADRIHRAAGLGIVLPLLLALGVAGIVYWDWSERAGHGDLRFYALVQFLPMALIPVACWLFPVARHTRGRWIAWMYLWYGLSKLFEMFDAQIFAALGGLICGHTLKHLAAAIATAGLIPMARAALGPLPPSRRARPAGA